MKQKFPLLGQPNSTDSRQLASSSFCLTGSQDDFCSAAVCALHAGEASVSQGSRSMLSTALCVLGRSNSWRGAVMTPRGGCPRYGCLYSCANTLNRRITSSELLEICLVWTLYDIKGFFLLGWAVTSQYVLVPCCTVYPGCLALSPGVLSYVHCCISVMNVRKLVETGERPRTPSQFVTSPKSKSSVYVLLHRPRCL
jgi:hypothetical protein